MAEFAETGDPTERYAAIETAYCQDRWPVVIDQGGKLLSQLAPEDVGLRQRLQLLMAHSYLYGFGERDAAEDLYRAVHESKAEASLRQIAAQGLLQCELPPPSAGSPAAAAPSGQSALGAPPQAPLSPENLPQPVGAPSLQEDNGPSLHESVQALIPGVPEEAAPPRPATPVMPWLERGGTPSEPPPTPAAEPIPASVDWQPSTPAREALEAEVIDEPELIEVHQADPRLAEEIELRETAVLASAPEVPDDPIVRQESQEDPPPPSVEERRTEPEKTGSPEEDFQAEDAELRQGLLRVEIL
jgi:hypothetical protein